MDINYQRLLNDAMLGVVKSVLSLAEKEGLEEEQSLYISFKTEGPGIVLSKRIKEEYPDEITIILQHQYKDLRVLEDSFVVNISFNNMYETIKVPFSMIKSFSDPRQNFNLLLKINDSRYSNKNIIKNLKVESKPDSGTVVSFNQFRDKLK